MPAPNQGAGSDQPIYDPAALASRLGLGEVAEGSTRSLKPGDVNPVWAVDTASGRWVIKTRRPAGPWWHGQAQHAAVLELAAASAGVSVPAARPPVGPDPVGLWSRIDDGFYARAMSRVDGVKPSPEPVEEAVAVWAGATLAALEAVAPPVEGSWPDIGYRTHPLPEWREWLDEAVTLDRIPATQVPEVMALVTELNAVIESSVQAGPVLRMLHRDVNRPNILLSPSGPVLLDFDAAGPQNPWWEVVGHAFALAAPEEGTFAPSRSAVEAVLTGYRDADGAGGPAGVEAFAGTLAARVSYAAFMLWNASGHRGGDDAWHRKSAADFAKAVGTLRDIAASAERWAAWLE